MLRCPRCGWETTADVVNARGKIRCSNCGRPIHAERLAGYDVHDGDARPTTKPTR